MLIEKVPQRTFLYDTKSPDYRHQHMRYNAWEGIGKELKLKRNFCVSLRDVRIVCPWLKIILVNLIFFALQSSVIVTGQTRKLVRWERQ
jgi:hypothetical protein